MLRGRKSESERFPGAVDTYTLEALMRDGKALQAATSHYLGQGFARTFDVRYTGRDGSEQYPYATSWGATTRLVGGVVMAHGDDRGLRLPPRVAPHQVVIVPIFREERARRRAPGRRCASPTSCGRPVFASVVDDRARVPARLQVQRVGAEGRAAPDRDRRAATSRRQRSPSRGATPASKQQIPLARAAVAIDELLRDVQASLFGDARDEQERRTLRDPSRLRRDDRVPPRARRVRRGAVVWPHECEARVKERQLRDDPMPAARRATDRAGACVCCGRPAVAAAVWAQAY